MKHYSEKDIDLKFSKTLSDARQLWTDICKSNYEEYGNIGTCVVGAGIEINFVHKGCRKPKRKMVISSGEVTGYQGSIIWEANIKKVLDFLAKNGIEASFNWGWMD